MKRLFLLAVVAATASTLLAFSAPAFAEPPSGFYPGNGHPNSADMACLHSNYDNSNVPFCARIFP
jgi:hypothetical protein